VQDNANTIPTTTDYFLRPGLSGDSSASQLQSRQALPAPVFRAITTPRDTQVPSNVSSTSVSVGAAQVTAIDTPQPSAMLVPVMTAAGLHYSNGIETVSLGSCRSGEPAVCAPEPTADTREVMNHLLLSCQEVINSTSSTACLLSGASSGILTPRFSSAQSVREEDEEEAELEREIEDAAVATEAAHMRLRDALAKLQCRRSSRVSEETALSSRERGVA
jgi:hypothetical protein